MTRCQLRDNVAGSVRRSIIDHQHVRLQTKGKNLRDEFLNVAGLIVGRSEDQDVVHFTSRLASSVRTMSWTSSLKLTRGCQPVASLRLDASPTNDVLRAVRCISSGSTLTCLA